MKYEEFIKEVQERGHLSSHEEVEAAAKAPLQALAERLARRGTTRPSLPTPLGARRTRPL